MNETLRTEIDRGAWTRDTRETTWGKITLASTFPFSGKIIPYLALLWPKIQRQLNIHQ